MSVPVVEYAYTYLLLRVTMPIKFGFPRAVYLVVNGAGEGHSQQEGRNEHLHADEEVLPTGGNLSGSNYHCLRAVCRGSYHVYQLQK